MPAARREACSARCCRLLELSEEGTKFRSYYDGRLIVLTPESSVQAQARVRCGLSSAVLSASGERTTAPSGGGREGEGRTDLQRARWQDRERWQCSPGREMGVAATTLPVM